jgi:hypothetical protein
MAYEPGARNNELKRLYVKRDAKFGEIVRCLGRELHTDNNSVTKTDWERFVEEAEELTDNWAVAETENKLPAISSELQLLLSEHQEICKRILSILDAEQLGH